VTEELGRAALDWHALYRLGPDAPWSECRLLDVTLTDATIELLDVPAPAVPEEQPVFLQIDSIADDDVGITMSAVVRDTCASHGTGAPVVRIEFRARREEQLLLHLLVRLHTLV